MLTKTPRFRKIAPYTDFTGLVRKTENAAKYGYTVVCPKCDGFGGYNYQYDNLGAHYDKGFCAPCNGWGYIAPANLCSVNADGLHVWTNERVVGNCLRRYDCACGKSMEVDSSG